jgi:hypothetical protein
MLGQALIDICPSYQEIRFQVGQFEAGVLKRADGLPEGLAFLDIGLGDMG